MGLKTIVKVNSVNNLSDARYCAGMGVDMMGFQFEESSRGYISPLTYQEITSWLSGPKYIGEFQNSSAKQVLSVIGNYDLKNIEVQNFQTAHELLNEELIVGLRLLNSHEIFDLLPQGSIKQLAYVIVPFSANWNEAQIDSLRSKNIFIDLSLEKDPLQVYEQYQFTGIALSGGDEIKPGLKDFDELADVLEALEEE